MPSLLQLAAEPTPSRAAVEQLGKSVAQSLAASKANAFRIDPIVDTDPDLQPDSAKSPTSSESPAAKSEPQ